MSENIGRILKTTAIVFIVIGIIGGIAVWATVGFLVGFAAVISCVLSCLMLYGFGQLVEDVGAMKRQMTNETGAPAVDKDELPDL